MDHDRDARNGPQDPGQILPTLTIHSFGLNTQVSFPFLEWCLVIFVFHGLISVNFNQDSHLLCCHYYALTMLGWGSLAQP